MSLDGTTLVISGTRRRVMIDSVSAWIAALVSGDWVGVAVNSYVIRSARSGRSQSRDKKYG